MKSQKLSKIALSLILAIVMVLTFIPWSGAYEAEPPEIAIVPMEEMGYVLTEPEINPDYIKWQSGEESGGVIPEKYVYERDPVNEPSRGPSAEFDSKYDPREDWATITPAKNQSSFETCWAFAALGSLESYVKTTSDVIMDFSEMHLAFATSKAGGNPNGERTTVGEAGSMTIAASYLMRHALSGAVLEIDDEYSTAVLERDVSVSEEKPKAGLVTGVVWIPNLTGDATPGSETSRSYANEIKTLVTDYGAACVSYKSEQTTSDGNDVGYNLIESGDYIDEYSYYTTSTGVNHAVIIVGWDDDFPKENFSAQPPDDGAWLVKNSWNTGSEDADGKEPYGYRSFFWMSYYTPVKDVCAVTGYEAGFSGAIYDYSPLMLARRTVPDTQTVYYSNIFDCEDTATSLDAVQFQNVNGNSEYEIYIGIEYTNVSTNRSILAAALNDGVQASGTAQYNGYYTVDVGDITLSPGQTIAIVIKQTVDSGTVRVTFGENGMNKDYLGLSYWSVDGASWTGGYYDCVSDIRAIVSDSGYDPFNRKGWTCHPREVDVTKPHAVLYSPTGTLPFSTFTNETVVLKFDETVIAIPGREIRMDVRRKLYEYDAVIASPISHSGTIHRFIFTIPEDFDGVSGIDDECIVTIPFNLFIHDYFTTRNLSYVLNMHYDTDPFRSHQILIQAGAFEDLSGNVMDFKSERINDGVIVGGDFTPFGTFFTKMGRRPFVYSTTPSPESIDVSPDSGEIVVTFNRQMAKTVSGSILLNPGGISLTGGEWSGGAAKEYLSGGMPAASAVEFTYDDGNVYTVSYENLAANTEYTITVSGFKDPDGNEVGAWTTSLPHTSTFVTGASALSKPGDVNGDGKVDATDLSILISDFGKSADFNPGSDVNDDGKVDATDLSILISNFGKTSLP